MRSLVAMAQRRYEGEFEVDEWGFDPDFTRTVDRLTPLRWSFTMAGFEHIPESGAALLVIGPRAKISEPVVVASALRRTCGRHLRMIGAADVPIGRFVARRLGGIPAQVDEVEALLRKGAVGAICCDRHSLFEPGPGPANPRYLAPAIRLGVPVFPVAVKGHELGRRWIVKVGREIPVVPRGGPLAATDLAEEIQERISQLIA